MAETPEHPTQGGSYQRDPDTGALTPLHQTEEAAPALNTEATDPNAQAPDASATLEA